MRLAISTLNSKHTVAELKEPRAVWVSGQKRNEQSPLMAMPIRSAILRMAVNSFVPAFGERSS